MVTHVLSAIRMCFRLRDMLASFIFGESGGGLRDE